MIHGTLGFRFLYFISSLDWALFGCGPSPSYLAHVPFCPVFMGWLVLLPCHCTAPAMISLIILSCCCLWAYKLKLLPAYFLHYFFFWALLASILARPAHFIPRASSTHFLLPYLFYSHEFLLNPLGFPGPITTFLPFGLIGLYANLMNLLIPFLGFLDPFYLFSISYNFHRFITSFLRLSWLICFLPGHLLFLWVC